MTTATEAALETRLGVLEARIAQQDTLIARLLQNGLNSALTGSLSRMPFAYLTAVPTDAVANGSLRVVRTGGADYLYFRSGSAWVQVGAAGAGLGGTPAVVLGTAAAAGVSPTFLRDDDTIIAFDATVPTTSAFSDSAATGSAVVTARRDHKHGREAQTSITAVGTLTGLATSGKITTYNNVTTAGMGVPAVYASGRQTAVTNATVASLATFTPAADGSFVIGANVNVTTATTHNFTVTCAYTDEGGSGRTLTLTFSQITGTLLTAITNLTGAGPYEGVPLVIRAKGSTSITLATAGTVTAVVYNVEGTISQVA